MSRSHARPLVAHAAIAFRCLYGVMTHRATDRAGERLGERRFTHKRIDERPQLEARAADVHQVPKPYAPLRGRDEHHGTRRHTHTDLDRRVLEATQALAQSHAAKSPAVHHGVSSKRRNR